MARKGEMKMRSANETARTAAVKLHAGRSQKPRQINTARTEQANDLKL